MLKQLLRRHDVIFVDFFDTLMFRAISQDQGILRWAQCISKKHPELPLEKLNMLPAKRKEIFQNCRKNLEVTADQTGITEVDYDTSIGLLYDWLFDSCSFDEKSLFVKTSRKIDFSIECGCQYPNRRLVASLLAAKREGKKIYCVSDFYLSADELKQFMFCGDIPEELFDEVFVSCDCGKRKATGEIYPFLLEKLNISPSSVLMIGDTLFSDKRQAEKYGINAVCVPHYAHKGLLYIKNKLNFDYGNSQLKTSVNAIYRQGMDYAEYISIFYVFTKRLYAKLYTDGVNDIAFMAREGYYLRKLFEMYQDLKVPDNKRINTSYYWCSRRSVMSGTKEAHTPEAMEGVISIKNWLKSLDLTVDMVKTFIEISDDEAEKAVPLEDSDIYKELCDNKEFCDKVDTIIKDNHEAFMAYTMPFVKKNVFRFVDSGWKGTTQNVLEKYYHLQTVGYYIGVQEPDKDILDLERYGLIFNEYAPRSRYYDCLGTNIPFYQQLLAAPHGTALKYEMLNDGVTIKEEWDQIEKELYEREIKERQRYMLLKFQGMCVWNDKLSTDSKEDWKIAKVSLKSSLFSFGSRWEFMNKCVKGYVQNFQHEKRGNLKYDYKKAKFSLDIIWKPEKYTRYISKVQRTSLYDKKMIRIIYPVVAAGFYVYTILLIHLKNLIFRRNLNDK